MPSSILRPYAVWWLAALLPLLGSGCSENLPTQAPGTAVYPSPTNSPSPAATVTPGPVSPTLPVTTPGTSPAPAATASPRTATLTPVIPTPTVTPAPETPQSSRTPIPRTPLALPPMLPANISSNLWFLMGIRGTYQEELAGAKRIFDVMDQRGGAVVDINFDSVLSDQEAQALHSQFGIMFQKRLSGIGPHTLYPAIIPCDQIVPLASLSRVKLIDTEAWPPVLPA